MDDRELIRTLRQADAILAAPRKRAFGPGEVAAACAVYCRLRPIIIKLLPVIGKIPIIGKTVAGILKVLMPLADIVCGCGEGKKCALPLPAGSGAR